jgi:hypothetical protein
MIQFTVHVELGQFSKPSNAFALDHDLRDRTCAIRDNGKLFHRFPIKIDADFVVTDATLIEKSFGLDANWAGSGTVDLDDVQWISWISLI